MDLYVCTARRQAIIPDIISQEKVLAAAHTQAIPFLLLATSTWFPVQCRASAFVFIARPVWVITCFVLPGKHLPVVENAL